MKLAYSKGYPTYMQWPKPWATSYFGFIFKYFLCPHGQSTLELLFGRNHQSFWENMFKVKLKNGSNFIYFVRTKSLFELFFIIFFFPNEITYSKLQSSDCLDTVFQYCSGSVGCLEVGIFSSKN